MTRDKNTPQMTNRITHSFQRLGNNLSVQPKLLSIATNLPAQNSRYQEIDVIHSKHPEFITFYSQRYLPIDTETNFLCKNDLVTPTFYKIDRARNILNGFRIHVSDENDMRIHFPRNSICSISIGFQSSPLID